MKVQAIGAGAGREVEVLAGGVEVVGEQVDRQPGDVVLAVEVAVDDRVDGRVPVVDRVDHGEQAGVVVAALDLEVGLEGVLVVLRVGDQLEGGQGHELEQLGLVQQAVAEALLAQVAGAGVLDLGEEAVVDAVDGQVHEGRLEGLDLGDGGEQVEAQLVAHAGQVVGVLVEEDGAGPRPGGGVPGDLDRVGLLLGQAGGGAAQLELAVGHGDAGAVVPRAEDHRHPGRRLAVGVEVVVVQIGDGGATGQRHRGQVHLDQRLGRGRDRGEGSPHQRTGVGRRGVGVAGGVGAAGGVARRSVGAAVRIALGVGAEGPVDRRVHAAGPIAGRGVTGRPIGRHHLARAAAGRQRERRQQGNLPYEPSHEICHRPARPAS